MRARSATPKEISYACKRFHYAKSVPAAHRFDYSVFNDDGEWCGVILYSYGSTPHIGKQYGLFAGEVLELIRVALNGKQECTSQAVSMTLKRLHHDNPQVKMVVSFADSGQGHIGTIYQASNWMYVGVSEGGTYFCVNGKNMHYKTVVSQGWKNNIHWLIENVDKNATTYRGGDKYKYLYFFDRKLRKKFASLSLPYPKDKK